jgi:hypothetical protein
VEPNVLGNKRDVEEGLLASGRPITYAQEDEDDVSIKKATCMKKLIPQVRPSNASMFWSNSMSKTDQIKQNK